MSLATPLALGLAALAVPLVLLYLLKPRREETVVPSTFLWQQALQEVQANAPWQKLRRNLLLLLQLLVLALLVLALARPLLASELAPGGDLVLILDASQSMAATDGGPSRWERAKDRVRALAENAGAGSRVALVSAGPAPALLAGPTAETREITTALSGSERPHGTANLRDAAILARSVAGRLADPTVILVGDGGPVETEPPPLPYPVRFDPVRGDGANAGVLGLSTRSGVGGRELWAQVGNYGPARTATLSLFADGTLFDARELTLPEDGTAGVEVRDLPAATVYEARLAGDDALPADDAAWHVSAQGPPARVLLYGQESRFLERALSLLPDVEVFRAAAGAKLEPGYDIYVVNGRVPASLPAGNVLLLGPTDSPLLPVSDTAEGLGVTDQQDDSPLLRFVDLTDTSVARASRLAPPEWMETLASSGDVPLLVAGETDGRRVAALAFSPEESDLPLQVAFPVLVDNLMRYLQPRAAVGASAIRPGETVQLPEGAASVVAPDGTRTPVAHGDGTYAATALPGLYMVRDGKDAILSRFAVNAGSPSESDIRATTTTPLVSEGATAEAQRPPAGAERWWPFALLALLILLAEWWLYGRTHRRRPARRAAS